MKFPSNKLEGVVSKEQSRYMLQAVKLDVEAKKLIATDGRILAAVPVVVDQGASSALIGLDAIKSIRAIAQRTKYDPDVTFADGKVLVTNHSERAEHAQAEGTFPNWQEVIPKVEGEPTISFDVNLLVRLADALRCGASTTKGTKHVSLWIRNNQDAILVKSTESADSKAIGVLMPVRP